MASLPQSQPEQEHVDKVRLHTLPRKTWVLRKGKISWKKGFTFRITDRRYKLKFSWQGRHHGIHILRKSFLQEGDTCARHAVVRATEYRKRIQVARASQKRCMIMDNSVRRPSDTNAGFSSPIKFKRRQLPQSIFPRLSTQQVIDNADDDNPNFNHAGPLRVSHVLGYIRNTGVTFERFYPTLEGDAEAEAAEAEAEMDNSEWEEVLTEGEVEGEGEAAEEARSEEMDGKEEREVEAVEKEHASEIDGKGKAEVQAAEMERTSEIDGKRQREVEAGEKEHVSGIDGKGEREVDAGEKEHASKIDGKGEIEVEAGEKEHASGIDGKGEREVDVGEKEHASKIDGKGEIEVEVGEKEQASEIDGKGGIEVEVGEKEQASENDEDEAEGVVRGGETRKRIYLKNWVTLCPVHGKRKSFVRLVVGHYMKGGPVVCEVACSKDFGKRFYAKKGYDFIVKTKEKDNDENMNKAAMTFSDSDSDSEIALVGHAIVVIGHGVVRNRLRWTTLRGRKRKRYFFLVQDSSGSTSGCFQNGLAIVLESSVTKVYAPYFSHLFRRKTKWQKKMEKKKKKKEEKGEWLILLK